MEHAALTGGDTVTSFTEFGKVPRYHLHFELNLDMVWGVLGYFSFLVVHSLILRFGVLKKGSRVKVWSSLCDLSRTALTLKLEPNFIWQMWEKKKKRTKRTWSSPPLKQKAIWWRLHLDMYGLYDIQWSLCSSSQFLPMISKWIPCCYFCDWKWSCIGFTKIITMSITYGYDISQFHKLQIEQPYYHSRLTLTGGSLFAGIEQRISHWFLITLWGRDHYHLYQKDEAAATERSKRYCPRSFH